MSQGPSTYAPSTVTTPVPPTAPLQRNIRRSGRPYANHGVLNVSPTHSGRDSLSVDYDLWSFDDRDYAIVCTVTNNVVNNDLSLCTPLFSEDACRQGCVQYTTRSGRCCNCGSTEHGLWRCRTPFKNAFSFIKLEFGRHDPDGSLFETLKLRMRQWRQQGLLRGRQANGRRNAPRGGRSRHSNRGHDLSLPGNNAGTTHAANPVGAPTQPARTTPSAPPRPASAASSAMRYGPTFTGYANPNTRQSGTFQVQPAPFRKERYEDSATPSISVSTEQHHRYLDTVDTPTEH